LITQLISPAVYTPFYSQTFFGSASKDINTAPKKRSNRPAADEQALRESRLFDLLKAGVTDIQKICQSLREQGDRVRPVTIGALLKRLTIADEIVPPYYPKRYQGCQYNLELIKPLLQAGYDYQRISTIIRQQRIAQLLTTSEQKNWGVNHIAQVLGVDDPIKIGRDLKQMKALPNNTRFAVSLNPLAHLSRFPLTKAEKPELRAEILTRMSKYGYTAEDAINDIMQAVASGELNLPFDFGNRQKVRDAINRIAQQGIEGTEKKKRVRKKRVPVSKVPKVKTPKKVRHRNKSTESAASDTPLKQTKPQQAENTLPKKTLNKAYTTLLPEHVRAIVPLRYLLLSSDADLRKYSVLANQPQVKNAYRDITPQIVKNLLMLDKAITQQLQQNNQLTAKAIADTLGAPLDVVNGLINSRRKRSRY
jgi:hypothetical protein